MPASSDSPSSSTAVNFFDKTPNEAPSLGIPFSAKVQTGDNLTTAGDAMDVTAVVALDPSQPVSFQNWVDTGVASADLTITGQAIIADMAAAVPPGPGVGFRVSGGVEGSWYMLHVRNVKTGGGDKLENEALLAIRY